MKCRALLLFVSLLVWPLAGAEPAAKEGANPARQELEKLGGFEPLPPAKPPLNVRSELAVIALPNELALELLPQLSDPKQADQAYATAMASIQKGRGVLVGLPYTISKPGQRVVVEQVKEVRFATEYGGAEPGGENPKAAEAQPFPTQFETRNVGVTLEVEPALDADGELIDLTVAASHVELLGMEKETVRWGGRSITVEQPRFNDHRATTALITTSGQRHVLGSFPSVTHKGWTEIFVFRCVTQAAVGK